MTTGTSGAAVTGPVVRGAEYPPEKGIPGGDISLLEIANLLLKRWRIVVGVPVLAASVALILAFVLPPMYTATTTFVPEVRSQNRLPSGIASLASQVGVSIGTEPSQSPRFYADVLRSRELLERILLSRYANPHTNGVATDSTTLLQVLRINGDSAADSLARGVKKLNQLISVRVDDETNIVRLSVDGIHPGLAAAVANRLVAYLNDFNAQQRQSQARERRKFAGERVAAADSELRRAEEAVKTFYERNRGWQQAPELVFEEGRLRRQVGIGQEVYLTLKRQYETSRIDEVNDTPVITVIDPAVPPQERSSPKRKLLVIIGFFLGGLVGALWAFGAEYADHVRQHQQDQYLRFSQLGHEARRDFARLLRGGFRRREQP